MRIMLNKKQLQIIRIFYTAPENMIRFSETESFGIDISSIEFADLLDKEMIIPNKELSDGFPDFYVLHPAAAEIWERHEEEVQQERFQRREKKRANGLAIISLIVASLSLLWQIISALVS